MWGSDKFQKSATDEEVVYIDRVVRRDWTVFCE
jgi:hypothetical protein